MERRVECVCVNTHRMDPDCSVNTYTTDSVGAVTYVSVDYLLQDRLLDSTVVLIRT